MNNLPDPAANLVPRLSKAMDEKDRGMLAILRRGLAFPPGQDLRAVAELEGTLYGLSSNDMRRAYCYLVAGLMALYSEYAPSYGDFGDSLGQLYRAKPNSIDSLKRRLKALVEADDEQLPERLRACVQLLKQAGITPDFETLLKDLFDWNAEDRRVQRRWLRSFFRMLVDENESSTNPNAIQSTAASTQA